MSGSEGAAPAVFVLALGAFGVAVVEEVPQLLFHVAVVDVHGDGADLVRGQHAFQVFRSVEEVEGDVVARRHAPSLEGAGHGPGFLVEPAPLHTLRLAGADEGDGAERAAARHHRDNHHGADLQLADQVEVLRVARTLHELLVGDLCVQLRLAGADDGFMDIELNARREVR